MHETHGYADRLNPRMVSGKASELIAAAKLLGLGHSVALPIVDDDGVDLVVDYRIPVQVKSAAQVGSSCYRFMGFKNLTADIYLFHGVADDVWWVVPRKALLDVGIGSNPKGLTISPRQRYFNTKYATLQGYRDAWHMFGGGDIAG